MCHKPFKLHSQLNTLTRCQSEYRLTNEVISGCFLATSISNWPRHKPWRSGLKAMVVATLLAQRSPQSASFQVFALVESPIRKQLLTDVKRLSVYLFSNFYPKMFFSTQGPSFNKHWKYATSGVKDLHRVSKSLKDFQNVARPKTLVAVEAVCWWRMNWLIVARVECEHVSQQGRRVQERLIREACARGGY